MHYDECDFEMSPQQCPTWIFFALGLTGFVSVLVLIHEGAVRLSAFFSSIFAVEIPSCNLYPRLISLEQIIEMVKTLGTRDVPFNTIHMAKLEL